MPIKMTKTKIFILSIGIFSFFLIGFLFGHLSKKDYFVEKEIVEILKETNKIRVLEYLKDSKFINYGHEYYEKYSTELKRILELINEEISNETIELNNGNDYCNFIDSFFIPFSNNKKEGVSLKEALLQKTPSHEKNISSLQKQKNISKLLNEFNPNKYRLDGPLSKGEIIFIRPLEEVSRKHELNSVDDTLKISFKLIANHLMGIQRYEIRPNQFVEKHSTEEGAFLIFSPKKQHEGTLSIEITVFDRKDNKEKVMAIYGFSYKIKR